MTKFSNLSKEDCISIVDNINAIFSVYQIDKKNINSFWDMVSLGIEKTERA